MNDTKVIEFRRLNEAANRYAERAESLFERQKQFIGNASHEMQTPLAICRNRLEMLVDDGSALTEAQLGEILKVQGTLDYLVRLNRSLLLLSKIENGQLNEQEAALPLATDRFPYYQWKDVHNFLSQRILMAQRILSGLDLVDKAEYQEQN